MHAGRFLSNGWPWSVCFRSSRQNYWNNNTGYRVESFFVRLYQTTGPNFCLSEKNIWQSEWVYPKDKSMYFWVGLFGLPYVLFRETSRSCQLAHVEHDEINFLLIARTETGVVLLITPGQYFWIYGKKERRILFLPAVGLERSALLITPGDNQSDVPSIIIKCLRTYTSYFVKIINARVSAQKLKYSHFDLPGSGPTHIT